MSKCWIIDKPRKVFNVDVISILFNLIKDAYMINMLFSYLI